MKRVHRHSICLKILPKVWKVLLKTVLLDLGFGRIKISDCHFILKQVLLKSKTVLVTFDFIWNLNFSPTEYPSKRTRPTRVNTESTEGKNVGLFFEFLCSSKDILRFSKFLVCLWEQIGLGAVNHTH